MLFLDYKLSYCALVGAYSDIVKSHLHVCCLVLNFSSLNTTPFQGSNKHKQIVKLELRRKTVFVWMLGRAAAAGHNCDDAASFKPEEPYKSH